jgi:hypothetical protein
MRKPTRRLLVMDDDMHLRYVAAVSDPAFRATAETRAVRIIRRLLELAAIGSGLCPVEIRKQ